MRFRRWKAKSELQRPFFATLLFLASLGLPGCADDEPEFVNTADSDGMEAGEDLEADAAAVEAASESIGVATEQTGEEATPGALIPELYEATDKDNIGVNLNAIGE